MDDWIDRAIFAIVGIVVAATLAVQVFYYR